MTNELGEWGGQFLRQFVLWCYQVHSGPNGDKNCVKKHVGGFGKKSALTPLLVKSLI